MFLLLKFETGREPPKVFRAVRRQLDIRLRSGCLAALSRNRYANSDYLGLRLIELRNLGIFVLAVAGEISLNRYFAKV